MADREIIIVGGGVIGLAIAWSFRTHDVKVTLIDPEEKPNGSASFAAGAMLGALGEVTEDHGSGEDKLEFEFRLNSSKLYPQLLGDLAESSSLNIHSGMGTFIVGNVAGKLDDVNIRAIARTAEEYDCKYETVDMEDIPGYSPNPNFRLTRGLFIPDEGFVSTADLMPAFLKAVESLSQVNIIRDSVLKLIVQNDRVVGVETKNNGTIKSDDTILAAGAAIQALVDLTPSVSQKIPPLLPGKGVSLLAQDPSNTPHVIRTPNRDFACGTHVVPRGNNLLYIGATNRIAATPGVNEGVTAGEVHNILNSVLSEINTELRTANILQTSFGSRPLTTDRHPLLGLTDVDGLSIATATYRNGILMAPLIGEIVAEEVISKKKSERNPFSARGRIERILDSRPDKEFVIDEGIRDLVSFIQEPTGSLPYDRENELRKFITALMHTALEGVTDGHGLREETIALLDRYRMSEVIPQIYYQVQD